MLSAEGEKGKVMIHRLVRAALITISLCALFPQPNMAFAESDTAEQLYEAAFRRIIEGDYGEAYDRFNEIISQYPDTVYARFSENQKRRLEQLNLPGIRRKKIDQSGRISTVVFSTLYSTWLGVGAARLANHEEGGGEKAVAAGMMIGAPAGLLTALILTRNARLTRGQSALINFGGYWGTWQGLGWALIVDANDDEKPSIRSAMVGGLSGILATSVLTRKVDPSLGDVGIINYGALWGTWLSLSAGIVADVEDGDEVFAWTLVGGNLGAAAMASLSSKIDISLARANLINLGGIVGTIVAGGILLIDSRNGREERVFAILMGGGIAGLIAGIYATRNFAPPEVNEKLSRRVDSTQWILRPHGLQLSHNGVRGNFLSIQF